MAKTKQTAMDSLRMKALNAYNSMQMPSLRYGIGIYADLAAFNIDDVLQNQKDNDWLKVEIDPRVKVINIASMDENFIREHMEKMLKIDENKLSALHYAMLNDAVALIIPKNTNIEKPIIINSNCSQKSKSESIIVLAEECSKVTILEMAESSDGNYYKSQSVFLFANENSEINYYSLQNLNENTYNFVVKRAEAKKDSMIKWVDLVLGSRFTQLNMKTDLTENGATTKKLGAFFGNNNQQFDINVESSHVKGNTESVMYHRGILQDNAKCIFSGKVSIAKDARNSTGHQKTDILLMGETAKCDAVPVLDVQNDEVVCSHGVTVGQLDPEQIFYLLSRGLDEEAAKQMLILGFLDPVMREINNEDARNKYTKIINKKLKVAEVSNVTN